jgi:O-succinylbenzoic acid--CoA ligase
VDVLEVARRRGVPGDRVLVLAPGPEPAAPWRALELEALDAVVERRARALREGTAALPGSLPGAGRIVPRVVRADLDGLVDLLALGRLGVVPAPLNPGLPAAEEARARADLLGRPAGGAQVVLWTSGTSGRPRGVALGWSGIEAHVDAVVRRLELEPEADLWAATLAPAHVGGFMLQLRALLTGTPLVFPPTRDAAALARLLEGPVTAAGFERPVTHLSLVPTQLLRLLEARGERPAPPGLRCVLLGGAHTPRELLDRALGAGWPVALTWGMTEMGSQVATAPPAEVARKPGSVGRPLEGVEVEVGPDEELRVRGAGLARACLDGTPLLDDEGWYHTGDLGQIDEEGALRITGRRIDRIVSGGVTVDAREVEETLRAHPSVAAACVAGVPDPEWGEVVGAWIEPVAGEFDPEEVDRWLRQRVAGPKLPRRWVVGDALPLNPNGKVDRAAVRERLAGAPVGGERGGEGRPSGVEGG